MASARHRTTRRPSSKDIAPANTSAVYSPRLKPAAREQRVTVSGDSARNFSTAARPATKSAGCANAVSSSFSFGPFTQTSSRSYPRISLALSHIKRTEGSSAAAEASMPTFCEPCPGNKNATGDASASAVARVARVAVAVASVTSDTFSAAMGRASADVGICVPSRLATSAAMAASRAALRFFFHSRFSAASLALRLCSG